MDSVGPAHDQAPWQQAFHGRDSALLQTLADRDPPGQVMFEVMSYVNGLYLMAARMGLPADAVTPEVSRVAAVLAPLRRSLGPQQRDIDLGLLRWIRRASALSVVIGAGATMDAGGPSWAELVRRLLLIALNTGHEVTQMVPTPESTQDHAAFVRQVIRVERLRPQQEMVARYLLDRIEQGAADTEDLMQAAQMCYDLFGQHLFTHLTGILYEGERRPGPIHRAIADLAAFQPVPDRGAGRFPGWDSVMTYNFEDLLGEALDARGLARTAWAMRGDQMAGDPNEAARLAGQDGDYLNIYHLHGYTPRRLFLITSVRFVFSTAQYLREYRDQPNGIIDRVYREYLANPVHYALYVGCSFADEAMNGLLRASAEQLPGRMHYALLQWPGPGRYAQASLEDLERAAERYVAIGVRPIWFDRFDEVPDLIRALE